MVSSKLLTYKLTSVIVAAMRMIVFSLLLLLLSSPASAGNSSKNFGGVGIDGAPWADGRIVVKQVVAGGPAHLAGIKPGDVITFIDGKPTEGSNFREMVSHRLRGVAGTPVTLKIRRPGSAKLITFNLVRRQLVIPPKSANNLKANPVEAEPKQNP